MTVAWRVEQVGEHSRDRQPSSWLPGHWTTANQVEPLVSDSLALAVIMLVLGLCGGVLTAFLVATFL